MDAVGDRERGGLTTAELGDWVSGLRTLVDAADDAECIDRLRLLEDLKNAAAAAQARTAAAFKRSHTATHEAAGLRGGEVGRGIGAQVALARRESPHRGGRLVGLAEALVFELPHTLAAMEAGEVSEWRATLVARETACLSRPDRMAVDAGLAGRLGRLGDRQVEAEARRLAYRCDPAAAAARCRKAAEDRRVTLRPAPDTMSVLTGLLPVAQGVPAYAALAAVADARRACGDTRRRGQIMADTLVERVTGHAIGVPTATWAQQAATITWESAQSVPEPPLGPPDRAALDAGENDPALAGCSDASDEDRQGSGAVGVELQVLMSDQTLFGLGLGADEPARLVGYGPIPAPLARRLAAGRLDATGDPMRVWVRRFYTDPGSGRLVAMESGRRLFTGALRRFVTTRDQVCRTPWCGAPIRHVDHALPVSLGGRTTEANG